MNDEITNEQLRLQIAPALGWKFSRLNECSSNAFAWRPRGDETDDAFPMLDGNEINWGDCPNCPEDIAAAMGLAALMAKTNPVGIRLYRNMAWVSVSDHRYVLTTIASGSADKPARAICLAFLAWKQAQS